jgi:hypothetical protein
MSVLDEAFTLSCNRNSQNNRYGIPQISDHFMNFLDMTLQLEPSGQGVHAKPDGLCF